MTEDVIPLADQLRAINLTKGLVILADESTLPVLYWFDEFAEECDPMIAQCCFLGNEERGWVLLDIQSGSPVLYDA